MTPPYVTIHPYNPDWPRHFDRLRDALAAALGPLALRIDHIGSTSVPGLAAKDIIDIQVTVAALIPALVDRLTAAGFVQRRPTTDHVPPGEDPDPRLWAKLLFSEPPGEPSGELPGSRRANIHVRVLGNPNQRYALLFRDYLRAHPHSAAAVERVKRELAKRFPDDIDAYLDIKDPVYDLIWHAAKEWQSHLPPSV